MNNELTKSETLFNQVDYKLKGEGAIIVAFQLKTPENIGHIIRLASNFSCKKVIFVGNQDSFRNSKIKKVAGAAFSQVDWCFIDEFNWKENIDEGYHVIAIETARNSHNITTVKMQEKVAFVLGNEVNGLDEDTVKQCDLCAHIPMTGKIKSMNVSQACAVALYEYVRQNLSW